MAATNVKQKHVRRNGQTMVEVVLLMALLSTVVVMVRNLVLGGPGSIGYDVMGYFVNQMDSKVNVGSKKAVLGGEKSWNYYYIGADVQKSATIHAK